MNERSFDRIAEVAAQAFLARGFEAVSLREVAEELGMKPASLYYHCPGGKAELYQRSIAAFLDELRTDLEAASSSADACLFDALVAMTDRMLSGQPLNLQRILRVDLKQLGRADAEELAHHLHECVLGPFHRRFVAAQEAGEIGKHVNPSIAAGSIVALVSGLGFMHLPTGRVTKKARESAQDYVRQGVGLLLEGVEG